MPNSLKLKSRLLFVVFVAFQPCSVCKLNSPQVSHSSILTFTYECRIPLTVVKPHLFHCPLDEGVQYKACHTRTKHITCWARTTTTRTALFARSMHGYCPLLDVPTPHYRDIMWSAVLYSPGAHRLGCVLFWRAYNLTFLKHGLLHERRQVGQLATESSLLGWQWEEAFVCKIRTNNNAKSAEPNRGLLFFLKRNLSRWHVVASSR